MNGLREVNMAEFGLQMFTKNTPYYICMYDFSINIRYVFVYY